MKELGWKEKHGIQNTGTKDSKGNIRRDKRKILKIWENYITQLYNQPNRPDERVKIRLDEGEIRRVKIGRGVRWGCCLSQILFNLYSECLTKEAVEGSGTFKIGGHVIRTEIYADDFVLPSKEEAVLQGTTDRLNDIERYCMKESH